MSELERLTDEERSTNARPSWRCTNPECHRNPYEDGECWTCPDCVAALRREVNEVRELLRRATDQLEYLNEDEPHSRTTAMLIETLRERLSQAVLDTEAK